jgi:putative aldouronate transport system substrate-binding protein
MIACLKLLNYGFTEDGMNLYNYGLEGENFEFNEDGSINWLRAQGTRGAYKGGLASVNFGYLEEEWQRDYRATWSENTEADQHVMFDVPMTTEEFDVYAADWGACAGFVSTEAVKFLTGARSLDEYDDFIDELMDLNCQGVLDAWNSAYTRFKNGESVEEE